jgi:dipeptidyl aminopeptidase/acylaminoacyl peptidase
MITTRRNWLVSLLAISACALLVAAQTKHAITHEDVWLMKRVGAPVPSPDGNWVVFSVVEPAYDEKDVVTDLWIVAADGKSAPRKLTNTKGAESGATWSPDSKSIAFSAKRDGDDVNQIYVLNIAEGGEAVRVTSLSTGARSPQFSPDGKLLLFTSSVFPGALNDEDNKKLAAERKARKYNARVYEGFPIRYWDKWLTDQQTHLFVQSLEAGAKAKDILAGSSLVKQKGFAGRMADAGEEMDAVWTPEGDAIVFAATTEKDQAAYASVSTYLYKVSLTGGEPAQLTKEKGFQSKPKFSPDGKALYSVFTPQTDKAYNLSRLAKFDWPAVGAAIIITAKYDRSVTGFAITSNGKTLCYSAESEGTEGFYMLDISDSRTKLNIGQNFKGATLTNLAIPNKSSSSLMFSNLENSVSPPEIVVFDLVAFKESPMQASKVKPLTSFNAERTAQIDWRPLREFTFTSKRGKQIHNFLALPPNFDETKKYPLFVVIHGGPHGMWRDQFFVRWNYHLLASPGYVVLLTNYTGSTGFGEKFAQDIQGDPLLGPGEEINQAADEAIKQFKFIDGTRQAAGGASYGGHLANWLQATTTRYKCLISHAGLINLESQWGTSDGIYHREINNGGPVWEQGEVWRKQNPIRYAANFKTPMLVTVGENDFRVPLNQSLENWSVLQRQKVPSKLIVFPDANHWILKGEDSRFFYNEVHAWLKKWL